MRSALLALLALGLLAAAPATARAAEPGAEPTAEQLAAAAFEQRFGGNVVEVWKTDWDGLTLVLGVARRWEGGKPDVLLRVLDPYKYKTLGFLLKERKNDQPSVTYYRSKEMFPPSRKTGRNLDVVVASWIERLPFIQGLPALADLWPQPVSEFTHRRLPDETLQDVRCYVLESVPKRKDGGYDRVVTVLAPDSNVALEKRWLRGEKIVRVDRVLRKDIDTAQGRPYARRHEIEQAGGGPAQIIDVANYSLDPVMPDQIFTTANLRIGRFPTY